jgi:hypothetical protein
VLWQKKGFCLSIGKYKSVLVPWSVCDCSVRGWCASKAGGSH